jgi:hypothetical protein
VNETAEPHSRFTRSPSRMGIFQGLVAAEPEGEVKRGL